MSIFISIPSYQDPLLLETICSAYENAENKDQLRFGVCEQAETGIDLESIKFKHLINYELVHPLMAKGPCWARARIQNFINNEQYYLQIDSHTIFAKNWDRILVNYHSWIESCLQNNFVITGYPRAFKPNKELTSFNLNTAFKETLGLAFHENKLFDDGHYSMQKSFPAGTDKPAKGLLVAGGFIFTKSKFVQEIPYDPKFYFHGEELSLALRLFTHGWDVAHIPRVPLFHLYTDVDNLLRKLHWDPEDEKDRVIKWNELDKKSKERLTHLVHNQLEGLYGLGSHRTVEEFGRICGIDLLNKEIVDAELAVDGFPFTEITSSTVPFKTVEIDNL
tara:strand:- start:82 stop:1083 length:1002 start_codon:yes stop_codon:yes gene_type:complete